MENLAFLVDKGALPINLITRWGKNVTSVYRLAYRAWLAAILCGLVRIVAEASLRYKSQGDLSATTKNSEERETVSCRRKVGDLCATIGWMPVATHCSLESGLSCFSTGLLGICGLVADFNELQVLWNRTR